MRFPIALRVYAQFNGFPCAIPVVQPLSRNLCKNCTREPLARSETYEGVLAFWFEEIEPKA